jgi:hypothetical protein
VTDGELILALTKVVNDDPEKPMLNQEFNPTDPVAVMIVLYECDYAVENYMKKFKDWRERFADPDVYDAFVMTYQAKARMDVKMIISRAQQMIAEELEQDEEPDEDGGV